MPNRWEFNNCISETGTPGAITNLIYPGCCCEITCIITNINNQKMSLTGITASFAAGEFTVVLNSIPPLPQSLNPGDGFQFTLTICADPGEDFDVLIIGITSAEHGLENHQFDFGPAPAGTVDVSAIDFGIVPIGTTSSPQTICITSNATLCQTKFTIDVSDCGIGVKPSPSVLNVDPGGLDTDCTFITWEPEFECQQLNCTINIEICDGIIIPITVTGQSTNRDGSPCAGPCDECLCCESITIITESEDAKAMDDVVLNCNDATIFDLAAVGEKKIVEYSFNYPTGLSDNMEFYFNPWLFSNNCDFGSLYPTGSINNPPPVAFYYQYNSLDSGPQSMPLVGAGVNVLNQLNWECEFEYVGPDAFKIRFSFFMINDFDNWITNLLHSNSPKWRRTDVNAVIPALNAVYQNTFPSVYKINKRLCGLLYLIDPNTLVVVPPNTVPTQPTRCWNIVSVRYTARWYNKGLYNGPSEFINPAFVFERSGVPVLNLSTIQKTEVKFSINIPVGFHNKTIFQLFDETTTDNTVDFLSNYDSSRAIITTIPGISVLNNNLQSPSSIVSLGGGNYEITAYIGTNVVMGHQYRIMAIVYSTVNMVNTFISDPLLVTNTPTFSCEECQPDVDSTWKQYYLDSTGDCIRPVAKERLMHQTTWNVGDLKTCISEWPNSNDWLDYVTTMRLNVYKRALDFPVVGQTTFLMINQLQSSRVVGFPGNWNNTTNLIVSDTGPASEIETSFIRRVGWEQTAFNPSDVFIANNATYMNRTPVGALAAGYIATLGATNDWRDDEIYYEYILTFDFTSLFGSPYQINLVKSFKVLAIQNEPDNSGFPPIIESMVFQGFNGTSWVNITGPFCPSDFQSLRVTYCANQSGEFIFFAEPSPDGNQITIRESENQPSPNGFPQLLNVVSLDSSFSAVGGGSYCATAILDSNSLANGLYLLCGYWSESIL
jgi:hypothetical protein